MLLHVFTLVYAFNQPLSSIQLSVIITLGIRKFGTVKWPYTCMFSIKNRVFMIVDL